MRLRALRPLALLAVGLAAVLLRADALAELGDAESSVACCQLTTSAGLDAIRGLDTEGDERIFQGEATPPNVHFLIDNSCSMRELPQISGYRDLVNFWGSGDQCANTRLIALQQARGWDPAASYAPPDTGTGLGADTGFPTLFQQDRVYRFNHWRDSNDPAPAFDTHEAACGGFHATGSAEYQACVTCLQGRGFYKRPGSPVPAWTGYDTYYMSPDFIFTGKFLNFNPPKYVTMRVVLKKALQGLRRMRVGLSTFEVPPSGDDPNGAALLSRQVPACTQVASDPHALTGDRPNLVNAVNNIRFLVNTPLAESLLNVGQLFTSSDDVYLQDFGFPASYVKNGFTNHSLNANTRSWCWGCQAASVIVLTDGEPTWDDNVPAAQISAMNGGPVTCPDGNGDGSPDCPDGEDYQLDDVAKLLHEKDLQRNSPAVVGDLDTGGMQTLTTYTIGFGISSALLRNAARVGGGNYYEARTADQLQQALEDILGAVQSRATTFASAGVSALQLTRTGSALVPRFRPGPQSAPWQGELYRFELADERVLNVQNTRCDPDRAATVLTGGGGDPNDLNRDGDCADVHMVDADLDPVTDDAAGNFVKARQPSLAARPYWEAGAALRGLASQAPAGPAWTKRSIWTVIDSNGDNRLDSLDTPVELTEANAALLRPYLGLGSGSEECQDLSTALGSGPMTPDECAALIIRYYRGADALHPDPARRGDDRPFLLQDIFHSAPVLVEPPASKFACGFGSQCLDGLFATPTPLQGGYGPNGDRDAYDHYLAEQGQRRKLALVGSNGGMLHAFHVGSVTGVDQDTRQPLYDQGTGAEVWAFVPPDLLPRLRGGLGRHRYFVDGTPMVRDAWLDGLDGRPPDDRKQAEEYRTLAVVGEGIGGTHRFALDVTDTDLDGAQFWTPGRFLWTWPQPCDALALKVGASFGNFAPKPPPIGAVALEKTGGPLNIGGVAAHERWIVGVNGGWDPYLNRGRGMALVDLANGATVWSFFAGDGSPNADKLDAPIVAALGLLDIGPGDGTDESDGLFDTLTVGDYDGNVWVARFHAPGHRDAQGKIDNWFAARALRTSGADPASARQPFTYVTSNILDPDTGYLHTYLGTGDRFHPTDVSGPTCRVSNPKGCALLGCAVSTRTVVTRGGELAAETGVTYSAQGDGPARFASEVANVTGAGQACQQPRVELTWNIGPSDATGSAQCEAQSSGSIFGECTGTGGSWACATHPSAWEGLMVKGRTAPTSSPHRFFGFWSYGGGASRRFASATEATAFDTAFGNATRPMSTDDLTVLSGITGGGTSKGNGWVLAYDAVDERTATGAAVVDGCVFWSSMEPSGSAAVCSAGTGSTARLYQASVISGAADCADAFLANGTYRRHLSRSVASIPAEPAPYHTVALGVGSSWVANIEGSGAAVFSVGGKKDLVQSIFQLEVDRTTHDCRHDGRGCP